MFLGASLHDNDIIMERKFKHKEINLNRSININTKKCTACWKCLDVCPENVFGSINIFFHKHAKIINQANCIGCKKCINVCEFDALYLNQISVL
jgi:Fe-S-cluster-containing hydrogenase component 2